MIYIYIYVYINRHKCTSNFRRVFAFYLAPPKDGWLPPGSFGFLRCLHCSVKGKHLRGTAEVLLELLGIGFTLW
jgi:hypothetical protein